MFDSTVDVDAFVTCDPLKRNFSLVRWRRRLLSSRNRLRAPLDHDLFNYEWKSGQKHFTSRQRTTLEWDATLLFPQNAKDVVGGWFNLATRRDTADFHGVVAGAE